MDAGRVKRRRKPLRRPFVVTIAAVGAGIPLAMTAAAGCGDNKPPYGATGGTHVGQPDYGPCTTEGATRACRINLGTTAQGFHSCFTGTQTCTAGAWSKCGGEGTVTNALPGQMTPWSGPGGGAGTSGAAGSPGLDLGLRPLGTLVDGSTSANVCTSDPCNPYCYGWDSTGGASVTIDAAAAQVVGVTGFGNINKRNLGRLLQDACFASNPPGPSCDTYGPGSLYACQIDTYCNMLALGGDGCCKQYATTHLPSTPTNPYLGTEPSVNLTLSTPCGQQPTPYQYVPVCNRGTTTLLPVDGGGQNITISASPPGAGPITACPTPMAVGTAPCSMPIPAAGIAPGTCILFDLSTCSGGIPSPNSWLYVNADYSITEGPVTPQGSPPLFSPAQPTPQPGCADNWSIEPAGNNPPACYTVGSSANTSTFQQQYIASCPPATHPQWHALTWNSSCPQNGSGSSEVVFEAATAPLVDGGIGIFTNYVTVGEARNNNGGAYISDPEVCTFATPPNPTTDPMCTNADTSGAQQQGPTPPCCPKDFLAQFMRPTVVPTPPLFPGFGALPGKAAANNEVLNLQITLKSSPDGRTLSTLNSWQVSYSCLPSE